uniref:Integrase catalytic domain-containing protein n=1 Tax=Amphimedon queenslandica TaxID=400682 RepID=A0A1X7VCR3_AMPQE
MFIEWKSMVEKSTGKKLKVLISNNGGKFTSNEFIAYLTSEGIKHELTIPRTPEQNGVAERANSTLIESLLGRSLVHCSLSEKQKPQKALSGSKPKVNHLRVFGCVYYAHIAKKEWSKLDSKGKKCVLLGYGNAIKVFNEERFGFEKESKTSDTSIIFELYHNNINELAVDDDVTPLVLIQRNLLLYPLNQTYVHLFNQSYIGLTEKDINTIIILILTLLKAMNHVP